jgi:hypothetical protein
MISTKLISFNQLQYGSAVFTVLPGNVTKKDHERSGFIRKSGHILLVIRGIPSLCRKRGTAGDTFPDPRSGGIFFKHAAGQSGRGTRPGGGGGEITKAIMSIEGLIRYGLMEQSIRNAVSYTSPVPKIFCGPKKNIVSIIRHLQVSVRGHRVLSGYLPGSCHP